MYKVFYLYVPVYRREYPAKDGFVYGIKSISKSGTTLYW